MTVDQARAELVRALNLTHSETLDANATRANFDNAAAALIAAAREEGAREACGKLADKLDDMRDQYFREEKECKTAEGALVFGYQALAFQSAAQLARNTAQPAEARP